MRVERFLHALARAGGGQWSLDVAGRLRDSYGRDPLLAVADDAGHGLGLDMDKPTMEAIARSSDRDTGDDLRVWLLRATGVSPVTRRANRLAELGRALPSTARFVDTDKGDEA